MFSTEREFCGRCQEIIDEPTPIYDELAKDVFVRNAVSQAAVRLGRTDLGLTPHERLLEWNRTMRAIRGFTRDH
jgi:hypothetical protein